MELQQLIQETEEKEEIELELALSNLTVKDEEKTIENVFCLFNALCSATV